MGMVMPGLLRGLTGLLNRAIPAWWGVRPPFLELHFMQLQTMFSHVVCPPNERGMTWSRLNWLMGRAWPQYWHWWLSRAKRFLRLKRTEL